MTTQPTPQAKWTTEWNQNLGSLFPLLLDRAICQPSLGRRNNETRHSQTQAAAKLKFIIIVTQRQSSPSGALAAVGRLITHYWTLSCTIIQPQLRQGIPLAVAPETDLMLWSLLVLLNFNPQGLCWPGKGAVDCNVFRLNGHIICFTPLCKQSRNCILWESKGRDVLPGLTIHVGEWSLRETVKFTEF